MVRAALHQGVLLPIELSQSNQVVRVEGLLETHLLGNPRGSARPQLPQVGPIL
jgi:hypothetical protein